VNKPKVFERWLPHWMKASSSLLDAFVGGVFIFSDPPPRIASHEPPNVKPRVAMASCGTSLASIGRGVVQGWPYVVRADLPAEDVVHSHHRVERLSRSLLQSGIYRCVELGSREDWSLELQVRSCSSLTQCQLVDLRVGGDATLAGLSHTWHPSAGKHCISSRSSSHTSL
jgi:hypothetical protein